MTSASDLSFLDHLGAVDALLTRVKLDDVGRPLGVGEERPA